MSILINIGVTVLTFIFMELVTWFTHKYVMHGFLWFLHEDHHQPRYKNTFEKNDSFFLIFAIPSISLFYYGTFPQINFLFFIGLGILLYGIAYFIIHDIFIHQRFKWFKNTKSKYLLALRKGHKVHHKYLTKEDGESFGMLFVPLRFFKQKYKEV
tara:strand:+ start:351 stop:815 length:465 start_codon:yes stop_codon:yes gene_type:complete